MDQGIIANFKVLYLQQNFREMLQEMDNCNMSVKEYWMSCNILKDINNIDAAWEEVTSTCTNKMWPQCVHDFGGFEEVPKVANKVAAIAQELGLDNIGPDDVTELVENHSQPFTNEELEDLAAQLPLKQEQQEQ
jgi:hypothetical protein